MKLNRYGIDAFDRLTAQDHGPLVYYADIEPLERIKAAAEKLIDSCSGGNLELNTVEIPRSIYLELVKAVQRPWEPTQ